MTTAAKPKAGLEDTVATSSAICYLDGDRGVLAYCGYDIHDLARNATFEEVCYLLWHRRLPTRAELGDLQSQFVAARPLPEPILRLMRALPSGNPSSASALPRAQSSGTAMDLLRTLTSALGHYDPDATDNSPAANYRKAVRLTSQIASLVATIGRLNKGLGPIQPDPCDKGVRCRADSAR
jgi:citrate synthase